MDSIKYTNNNQSKNNIDNIININEEYSAMDMIDVKHTKWFNNESLTHGTVTIGDYCEMLNRNYFDALANHTKKYRTSPNPILNFKNALGRWINDPVAVKRIPSNLKLLRLVLVAEKVSPFAKQQAMYFNEQNHVLHRENGQTIFKKVELLTVTQYLQNLEAQPWFQLRPNALEELKIKYLNSTEIV